VADDIVRLTDQFMLLVTGDFDEIVVTVFNDTFGVGLADNVAFRI
jgi:hypothetical protein